MKYIYVLQWLFERLRVECLQCNYHGNAACWSQCADVHSNQVGSFYVLCQRPAVFIGTVSYPGVSQTWSTPRQLSQILWCWGCQLLKMIREKTHLYKVCNTLQLLGSTGHMQKFIWCCPNGHHTTYTSVKGFFTSTCNMKYTRLVARGACKGTAEKVDLKIVMACTRTVKIDCQISDGQYTSRINR